MLFLIVNGFLIYIFISNFAIYFFYLPWLQNCSRITRYVRNAAGSWIYDVNCLPIISQHWSYDWRCTPLGSATPVYQPWRYRTLVDTDYGRYCTQCFKVPKNRSTVVGACILCTFYFEFPLHLFSSICIEASKSYVKLVLYANCVCWRGEWGTFLPTHGHSRSVT